jgi:small subunit ribosomal protein S8
MHSDPVADMLTRIRNASSAGHRSVMIPFSRFKLSIAQVLQDKGFVSSVEHQEAQLCLTLKYNKMGEPVIRSIKRVSRPGLRVYKPATRLPRVLGGAGMALVSTSQGLLSDHEARKHGVGGEVLFMVY